ncbi:MAG: peptide ABC transporter substrate-binding protein [Patescibacteria group bacterium]
MFSKLIEQVKTLIKKGGYIPTTTDLKKSYHSLIISHKIAWVGLFALGTLFLIGGFITLIEKQTAIVIKPEGALTEGLLGTPRFINPVLAINETDRTLTNLIYSGLLRLNQKGELIPDLALYYNIDDDGLTYTFKLKPDLTWHDNTPLTSSDIVFTIETIKNRAVQSPRRIQWEGVEVTAPDNRTIVFKLPQAYSPFIENFTLGILPQHVWQNTDPELFAFSEYNFRPIGSGPYKFNRLYRDENDRPYLYELTAFKNFALGQPGLKKLKLKFFLDETNLADELSAGKIDSAGALSPSITEQLIDDNKQVLDSLLPRIFGVFFNQNQAQILARSEVRQALDEVVDRQTIINQVLLGFAKPITGPLEKFSYLSSDGLLDVFPNEDIKETEINRTERIKKAKSILTDKGWELKTNDDGKTIATLDDGATTLNFTLTTVNTPELKQTAQLLQKQWEAIGAQVEIEFFEEDELNQNVIRARKYDALLYGLVIGQEPDPFVFWHSSQRQDPGLNISMYANVSADKLLEEIRQTTDKDIKTNLYQELTELIKKDRPAIFLYSPQFTYILPNKIKGVNINHAGRPADRFNDIYRWYIKTEKIWRFLTNTPEVTN